MKIGLYGNCQIEPYGLCLQKLLPSAQIVMTPKVSLARSPVEALAGCALVFVQAAYWDQMLNDPNIDKTAKILKCPTFYFSGLFPDVMIQDAPRIESIGGIFNSSIALYGFVSGLSAEDTTALFCQEVYIQLGFYKHYQVSKALCISDLNSCNLDGARMFAEWESFGVFAHTPNHPTVPVALNIAMALTDRAYLRRVDVNPDEIRDALSLFGVWPVYPEIAAEYGLAPGSTDFKFVTNKDGIRHTISLLTFIQLSFKRYHEQGIKRENVKAFANNPKVYSDLETVASSRPLHFIGNGFYDRWLLEMAPFVPVGGNAYEIACNDLKHESRSQDHSKPLGGTSTDTARIARELEVSARVVCEEEMLDRL